MFELRLSDKSARLLRLYESEDLKAHQKAALSAHKASAAADTHTDAVKMGKSDDFGKAAELHADAARKHHEAASSLFQAGQHSMATEHAMLSKRHLAHARHYDKMRDAAPPAEPAKAVGAEERYFAFPEMRQLAGLQPRFPSLAEARAVYGKGDK